MFDTDYIMRIIRQFAESLARIILNIKRGSTTEARVDMQAAAERFLGLQLDIILSLSSQGLIDILGIAGESPDVERLYIAAQLIFCEAEIRGANDRIDVNEMYVRSLDLLLRGFTQMDETLQSEAASTIDQIVTTLQNDHLLEGMYESLIPYYEQRGQYSRAEDSLFRLAESGFEKALQLGESFYGRLLKRTDQDLETGNLPRTEVKEGLQELKSKFGS